MSLFSGLIQQAMTDIGQQITAQDAEKLLVRANADSDRQALLQARKPTLNAGNSLSDVYGSNSSGNFLTNNPLSTRTANYSDVDSLIQGRTPEALSILGQGSNQQILTQRSANQAGLAPLQQVDDLRAFGEQQAILGLLGEEAQEQAIGGIPVSQFDQEMQSRQRKQLQRGAAARGELGGGATFEAGAQLAGAQQANIIQNRLGQLEPLVALSRGVRSDMSGQLESGAVREANIQQGLGVQQGNIRMGATAPVIQGIKGRAEVAGLQGIASAQQKAQTNNQLASLAGSFFG